MAGMERAHGGHEGNIAAIASQRGYGTSKRFDFTDYLHRLAASDTGLSCSFEGLFAGRRGQYQEGQARS
jgi:hypothetical protein